MFFKRSLVMTVGVLLFIGAFLLRSHLSESHLENTFKDKRVQYGVQDANLTLNEAAPPAPIIAPAVVTPAAAPAPATTDSSSGSDASPAPGNTADPNTLIGPVAPNAAPAPSSTPDNSPAPAPAPDTNSGPMMPAPSTMNRPHSSLRLTSGPARLAVRLLALELAQTNSGGPAMSLRTEDAPSTATPPKAEIVSPNALKAETPATAVKAEPVTAAEEETASNGHAGGRAIILGYHQFTGPGVPSRNIYSMSQDVFESEMKYLRDNNYNVVPLSDVVAFVEHKKELPPNAVAITIDDGYKSALNYAAPVLKKYGYTWTYFVYPSFITRTEGKGAASWPDLLELGREGVDVECHSMTHPQLNKKFQDWPPGSRHAHLLTDAEYDQFLDNETVTAKAELEKELGKQIKYFAYPYGAYNSKVEAKVRAAGFEAVFTVAGNPIHITTQPYRMGRYIITKPVEHEFAAYLHQGALGLVAATPEPGAIVTNPKPVITAVLDFQGDPSTLETDVRDYGIVKHDFDPETSTLRLYLPRPLVQPDVEVNIRQQDPKTGQVRVANWSFNYEAAGAMPPIHPAIGAESSEPATPAVPETTAPATNAPVETPAPATNAPAAAAVSTVTNATPATNATPTGP